MFNKETNELLRQEYRQNMSFFAIIQLTFQKQIFIAT